MSKVKIRPDFPISLIDVPGFQLGMYGRQRFGGSQSTIAIDYALYFP